jgi:hypothetical protein
MKLTNASMFCVITILTATVFCCNRDDNTPDETPPVLSVPPVDISTVTSIIAFGSDLSVTQKNPAFEYYVNTSNGLVSSVCPGYVENIMLNDNFPDYEVWIKPSASSAWTIIYDHVLNVSVSDNENVSPGDILGTVGVGNRTELQINKIVNNSELSYCPFDFGTNDFIQLHRAFTEVWCIEETVVP